MRYLNLAWLLVAVGSAAAFGCGSDSADDTSVGGANSGGHAGTAGKGGSAGKGGTGGEAGTLNEAGEAGEVGIAGEGGAATGGGGSLAGNGGTGGSAGKGGTAGTSGTAGAGGTSGSAGTAGRGGTAGTGGLGGGAGTAGTAGSAGVVGSIQVTFDGLPVGETPSAAVSGPASYAANVSVSQTLSNLALGSYTVSAAPIQVPGAQVDAVYDATITGTPAAVTQGATSAVAVTYAQRLGTGLMWVLDDGDRDTFGFDAALLAKTGTVADAAAVNVVPPMAGTNDGAPVAVAFSPAGDAWLAYCRGSSNEPQAIAKFGPAKIGVTGAPTADVVITLPVMAGTYDCASSVAFDAAGNLWVGFFRGHVIRYAASQLVASGAPVPEATLSGAALGEVEDLLFGTDGSLFVASFAPPAIVRLAPTQLTADDPAIVPTVSLALPAGAGPNGLAFSSGRLWVADYNQSQLLAFNTLDLGASGAPTPAVTITGVAGPAELAFDRAGNLWVASFDGNQVLALAAADLATSGAKTPLTTLTAGGRFKKPYGLRFNPG